MEIDKNSKRRLRKKGMLPYNHVYCFYNRLIEIMNEAVLLTEVLIINHGEG
jgi:hypothetical protein